jgi:hypothetical protein
MTEKTFITIDNILKIDDILTKERFVSLGYRMYKNNFPNFESFYNSIGKKLESFYDAKVKIFTDMNVHYNTKTERLHIYNGIITSKVIRSRYVDNYQLTKTKTGSIYVTVVPTYFRA